MKDDKDWDDAAIKKLRELWADPGNSLQEIGRKMLRSKNSISGKAHRLNLPPRPSPIKRSGEGDGVPQPRVFVSRRVTGATLPVLASLAAPAATPAAPAAPPPPAPLPAPEPPPPPVMAGRVRDCCWPIGEPGSKAFRFCGEASLPGRNYCQEHHAISIVSPRTLVRESAPLPKIEAYASANLVRIPPASGLQGLLVAVNNHRRAHGLTPFALRASASAD